MQRHWLVTLQNLSSTGRSWDADVSKALLQDKQCGSVNIIPGLQADVLRQKSRQPWLDQTGRRRHGAPV